ncbi:MAG: PIN domain-containing protein [Actinomycetota bacterium]|nr:PIN domain-containing protein [Actinomycetota bacterium]
MELTAYRNVVLDTSACIYFLEGPASDPRHMLTKPIIRAAEEGEVDVSVSVVSVTELLTGPLRAHDRLAEAHARLLLYEICRVVPMDVQVAEYAARLRVRYGLRTPDAIVCATGVVVHADAVVGNDERWKQVAEIPYRHLDDLVG